MTVERRGGEYASEAAMVVGSGEREVVYVLLVEDDQDDYYLTQDVLKQVKDTDYRLIWAGSYERAYNELAERHIDVALVDYQIGDRTGLEFIREKAPIYPGCPMILVTGLRDADIDRMALEVGAADYVPKDSLSPELIDRSIRYARGQAHRHALLDTVIANTSTGVVALDVHDQPLVWNAKAMRAIGLPDLAVAPINVPDVAQALAQAFPLDDVPGELTTPGGHVFELIVSRVASGGRVIAFHDVTKRIQAEQWLRQAIADAESASAAKSSFLANMSHELRTPLNGILGLADIIAQRSDDEIANYARAIARSGNDLLRLINDILDLSKIEAGRLEIEDIEFEIEPVLSDVVTLLTPAVAAKGLDIACFVDPGLPRTMRGDPHRLKQVVTNLVGNAIKFTHAGGICLMARHVGAGSENAVELSVHDTGIGIGADKVERLFQRFSQVDVSTTRKYGGTGLGLALCRELLELMKGEIWCESTEGVGSVFRFLLPLAEIPATVRARIDAERTRLAGRNLLAVGAGPATRNALEAYAESAKWTLATVDDVAALAVAGDPRRFDCILLAGRAASETTAALATLRRLHAAPDCVFVRLCAPGSPRSAAETGCVQIAAPLTAATWLTVRKAIPARVAARAQDSEARGASLRILLVEDNPSNQMVATLMLKTAGYAIDVAENGAAAVETVTQREFDVILMDLHMPVMDGLEATRRIRAIDGRQYTPIIGLTASALKSDRQACIEAGMTDHMSKPVDWNALIAMLREIERHGADASAA
ncbi:MAG: response regulator [Hyphomicrobiaceae bacterium]